MSYSCCHFECGSYSLNYVNQVPWLIAPTVIIGCMHGFKVILSSIHDSSSGFT